MPQKPSPIRPTTEHARQLAQDLIAKAKHVALAVLDPETGGPYVSRVLMASMPDGTLTLLVSHLSAHTKALLADSRASLLIGEPGKGDPLAHPRISVQCLAQKITREMVDHATIREAFLSRHPKSKLYIDFADFLFFRLTPVTATLNGGFGQAFLLNKSDLMSRVFSDDPYENRG
jgi:heme iron utilization protein